MSKNISPIRDLVERRLKVLGIRRGELACRCGFKNVHKGIRRIDAVCGGDLDSLSAGAILKALPMALEVCEDVAVRQTVDLLAQEKRIAATEQEAAWRASFKPHAYLCGMETRPSSITVYAFSGGP